MLELFFRENHDKVLAWLDDLEKDLTMPLYFSVDVRDAGYKAAVVDANIFPAGWNNLTPVALTLASEAASEYFAKHFPGTRSIGIVPENHTRNKYYFDNLTALRDILKRAGFVVEFTHINPELDKDITTFEGGHDNQVRLLRLKREGSIVRSATFSPDLLLLNNDLAQGFPEMLRDISQPIVPHPGLGWFQRKKSRHFEIVSRVLGQFGDAFGIDPWLLGVISATEQNVDFHERVGLDRIAAHIDEINAHVRKKYAQYKISEECVDCAFIKDNSGTYGQAIIHVANSHEVLNMNRKTINQMDVGKGSVKVNDVLIQECVPTKFKIESGVGEPVMYMMGDTVVGGFARINTQRGPHDNLNAPGGYYAELESLGDINLPLYEFLTRVARIGIAYEMTELQKLF